MTEESVRKYINGIYGAMKWAVADGKLLKSPCENFSRAMIKTSETVIILTCLNRMKLRRFFHFRGSWLEPVNVTCKGDFINIARFTLGHLYWGADGARVNEIAQLLLDDVLAEDGVYYLNLESDSENGKKLKTLMLVAKFRFTPRLLIRFYRLRERLKRCRVCPPVPRTQAA